MTSELSQKGGTEKNSLTPPTCKWVTLSLVMFLPLKLKPEIQSHSAALSISKEKASMPRTKWYRDKGSPCLNSLEFLKKLVGLPLSYLKKIDAMEMHHWIHPTHFSQNTILWSIERIKFQFMFIGFLIVQFTKIAFSFLLKIESIASFANQEASETVFPPWRHCGLGSLTCSWPLSTYLQELLLSICKHYQLDWLV